MQACTSAVSGEACLDGWYLMYQAPGLNASMRPYIDRCQDLPNGIDGYLPKSASDIAITAQVMKWMQRWPFRSIAERKWFTTADAIELPDY